ncbi:hypothetical protein [Streptomyces sp. NBC_01451]|uniref:hypothetical protein n=1 Tax=Streptomyces sp. NBC_01451 TaxID=2903872 RepID=UPI002E33CDA6|nr:hypothetical protein [Streptomyces sp. NBC_01451]
MTVAIAPSETSEMPEPAETPEVSPVSPVSSVSEEFDGSEWSEPSAEPDGSVDAALDAAEVSPLVTRDAQEFGAYARTGGWAFGLKVARSVRPGGQPAGETPKVSAKEFAALADCSPERVMRYYKAWDKAADDGVVPHFEALAPGAEVELPGADLWLTYYSSRSSAGSERGAAITEAAEAEGIRPTKALEVAENPTALRAAIMADPSTARAARHALLDRIKEDPDLQAELARDIVRTDDLKKAVASESRSADRVGYVRQIAESGQVRTPAGQTIEAPVDLRQEAERHLSLLDELDEDEDTGEWASEAYDTLKNLVVEAVEADPELRVQERRTKFYSSLTKATKAFEELTFDDVQEFAEDDMVQQLEELQEAIASCITALRGARTPSA